MNRDTATPHIKVTPPGPISRRWTEFHMAHAPEAIYFHDLVWDRSQPAIGPFMTDPDGNVFMDFCSHGAAFPLGYNNPELIEAAQKAARIAPSKGGAEVVSAWGQDPQVIDSPLPSHLLHRLTSITKPYGLDTAFLSNSGSEAVENSLKLCYAYRRNLGIGFCFERAFHGRTLGAASLTRSRRGQRAWYPHLSEIIALPFCHCPGECRCGWKRRPVSFKEDIGYLEELLDPKIGNVDPDQVAFIMIEAVQGEGGYNFPAPGFLQEVAATAKRFNIPLIVDEIQSGLGRTGKWFAFEHYGIEPDVIALAKSLRVGATVARRDMFPKESGRFGGTWVGTGAIDCAVGYRVLEIIERDNLLDNATRVGGHLLEGLKDFEKRYPKVKNARGLGLMLAMTLEGEDLADRLMKEAFRRGLFLLTCGFDSIRMIPPLDITVREADIALNILDEALKAL